jgi:NAD(P)-dependent dehydrogenase (short-subunit alcohol dehydrogenase family)
MSGRMLVTGGAGFIGANLADRLAQDGHDVLVYDALARPGVEANLDWLRRRHPQRVTAIIADIRDPTALAHALRGADAVFHLAAQVAVTTSLADPAEDFAVNLQGTFTCSTCCGAARAGLARWSSRAPTRSMATSPILACVGPTLAGCRVTSRCVKAGSGKTGRWIFTLPMAARRVRPINMCWISRAATACPPWFCA